MYIFIKKSIKCKFAATGLNEIESLLHSMVALWESVVKIPPNVLGRDQLAVSAMSTPVVALYSKAT